MSDQQNKATAADKAVELTQKIADAEKCLPKTNSAVVEHSATPVKSDASEGRSPQFGK